MVYLFMALKCLVCVIMLHNVLLRFPVFVVERLLCSGEIDRSCRWITLLLVETLVNCLEFTRFQRENSLYILLERAIFDFRGKSKSKRFFRKHAVY